MYRLNEAGYKNVVGLDRFQKIRIPNIKFTDVDIRQMDGKFDLVMMHHSLEHMDNPSQVLLEVKRLLSEEGTVLIRIPIANQIAWDMYGTNWYQIDAPRHLVIPSLMGAQKIIDDSGFEIKENYF